MLADEDDFEQRIEEENYFVSMTDMMVGLIFIFIILLMYYALQLQQASVVLSQTTIDLTSADQTRNLILRDVQDRLKRSGLKVEIDTRTGVLRLPDEVLFDSARADIKPEGVIALRKLGDALQKALPCYTDNSARLTPQAGCPRNAHHVESLYIEGHTDSDPLSGNNILKDNWDLSVMRATNTYRRLTELQPTLMLLCLRQDDKCDSILSVSGYGPDRPVAFGDDATSKAKNRRIDLRILMQSPHARGQKDDADILPGWQR